MQRRSFSREFKVEAVRLVRERSAVAVQQLHSCRAPVSFQATARMAPCATGSLDCGNHDLAPALTGLGRSGHRAVLHRQLRVHCEVSEQGADHIRPARAILSSSIRKSGFGQTTPLSAAFAATSRSLRVLTCPSPESSP